MSALATPNSAAIRIRPPSVWAPLDVRELWRYRGLLLTLGVRDVKLRYKQTALGVAWVILQPLLAAGIFAFVFGKVASLEAPGGVPYFLFAFAGMLAWNLFSRTLLNASQSTLANTQLVAKVYFPRLILPLSTVFAAMLDFAVPLVLLFIMLLVRGHGVSAPVLLLPLCAAVLVMLAVGLGFICAALAIRFRDVKHIMPVAVQMLLYASPVAYATQKVRDMAPQWDAVYHLNPLVALLETFRYATLGIGEAPWGWLVYSTLVSALVFIGGGMLFKRMERGFADVI